MGNFLENIFLGKDEKKEEEVVKNDPILDKTAEERTVNIPVNEQLQTDDLNNKLLEELRQEKENNRNLKLIKEQYEQQIDKLKQRNEELTKQLESLNETNAKEQTSPEAEVVSESNKDTNEDSMLQVEKILEKLSNLISEENANLIALSKKAQDVQSEAEERLNLILRQTQEDRYKKDKLKIIMRSIRMRSMIEDLLCYYESEKMEGFDTKAAVYLQDQLKNLVICIDADLSQEMVYKIKSAVNGDDFNENHMDICGIELTENPDLSGKVYKSLKPAYYWTLPYVLRPRVSDTGEEFYSYKFIISQEQVITYKYDKK